MKLQGQAQRRQVEAALERVREAAVEGDFHMKAPLENGYPKLSPSPSFPATTHRQKGSADGPTPHYFTGPVACRLSGSPANVVMFTKQSVHYREPV
ncbi:hypothetical protein LSP04_24150 [Levilactobacillus spicheri]|uniref:Uncharacterized protein n=1 Tax=Levilactobacillus spicheri TaxID=216463 RepID=A0ABQ0WSK5_9LACO|nr:hypothetical protein LSP04_24150 [Levilactobacillus spicheri]